MFKGMPNMCGGMQNMFKGMPNMCDGMPNMFEGMPQNFMAQMKKLQQLQNNPYISQMQQIQYMQQWCNYLQQMNLWAMGVGKQIYDHGTQKMAELEAFHQQLLKNMYDTMQQAQQQAAEGMAEPAEAEAEAPEEKTEE